MKTPKQTVHKPWWKRLWSALHILFNVGLFLYLGAQSFLVYLLYRDGEIPIPSQLVSYAEDLVSDKGVQVDIGSIKLDMRGILLFRDVKLNLTGYHEAVAEADLILVDFPLWGILGEHFAVNQIWISHCHLYCPTVLSPTGKREEILTDVFTEISTRGESAEINRLLVRFGNLDVMVKGGLNLDNLKDKTKTDKEIDPAKIYAEVCRKLLEARPWVQKFTEPRLVLGLNKETDVTRAELRLHTNKFNLGDGVEGDDLNALVTIEAHDLQDIHLIEAFAGLSTITWKGQVDAAGIQLEAVLPPPGAESLIPDSLHLAGHDFKGWDLTMEAFSARVDIKDFKRPSGSIHLQNDRDWMNLDGWIETESGKADLTVSALWDPAYFFQSSLLKDMDEAPKLISKAYPRWQAHVIFGEKYEFESVEATLALGETQLESLALKSVDAHVFATPERVDVTDAVLSTSRYTIKGMYWQEFTTDRYRFVLSGNVEPLDIAFIIDEQWWDELWTNFKFHSVLPYSNIDISGTFGEGDKGKYFFGYNRLVDFTYNGVYLKDCSAMLWRSPYQLTLYKMSGYNTDGVVDLILQFNYIPEGKDRKSLAFTAASTLPINQGADLAGPEVHEITDEFTLTSAPDLQVLGLAFGDDSSEPGALYMSLDAAMATTTTYEEYIFDWLKLKAYKTPTDLEIRHAQFGLANGTGMARADIAIVNDERRDLTLDLSLRNARYQELMTNVPLFHHKQESDNAGTEDADVAASNAAVASTDPPPAVTTESATSSDGPTSVTKRVRSMETASIDIDVHSHGTLGDISSFTGYGKLGIQDAYFGQLHLFGGLSRATQTIGLNLGTVDFTRGEAPFLLGKGYLHLPDIKVSGPTARVVANGNIDLENKGLDFYLALYPLGSISTPVVSQIVSIFNPISNTVEAHLTGTLKDPKWNVGFNPLSIITGQNTANNPTGETMPQSLKN